MQIKHLIHPEDFTIQELNELIDVAHNIFKNPQHYQDICKNKILATLFYEPSTRTRLSFESAMLRLGGNVIGFSDANTSSVSKGESIVDTIRIISSYANLAAIRHPKEGAPKLASKYSTIPIINAGDGGHEHPTQTLTDLFTIHMKKGSIKNQKIAFCGDLKFGRTVHSLIRTLCRYNIKEFILISPNELKLPYELKNKLIEEYNVALREVSTIEEVIEEIDILYMTRIQKERFFNEADYERLKNSYILDLSKLRLAKEDMIIMHPLPRVNEIAYEVDEDPRAVYFEQASFGVYIRMALILKLLGVECTCLK
ncbi:aspartate carbamoyltransferase [Inediibacterium massiliense]|uniref:aspartate carbamoyltransferase n=1 Tax=Inediibacterium massiliense TaxID=1658111 RepID=UPI0006B63A76|nr:aspartate carbamoyltransferase [Inediibacterium massiliense]